MKNNYKNIVLATSLLFASVVAQAATRADGTAVWFAGSATGGLTAQQAQQVSADTATFWNSGEPNDYNDSEDCAVQQAAGGWNDLACNNNSSRRAACFNGSDWALSTAATSILTAAAACPAGYVYAAPTNLPQRNALSARMVADGVADVWINALDFVDEDIWILNSGTSSVLPPFWNAGEPGNSGSGEHCAEVMANGLWNDLSCDALRPVVCATIDFTDARIAAVADPVAFSSVNDLHTVCQQSLGQDWHFAAPRSLAERNALSTLMTGDAISAAWINAHDRQVEGYWMLNHGLFNWAAGQPDFSTGICATIRQSDGRWVMADCDSEAKLLCSDGYNWVLRNFDHQFSNQALDACGRPDTETLANPFVNYRLKTPVTEGDRNRALQQVLAAGNGVNAWLNLKRVTDTNRWLVNEDYRAPVTAGGDLRKLVWYDIIESEGGGLFNPNPTFYSSWKRYEDGATIGMSEVVEANKALQPYFDEGEPNDSGACVQLYISNGLWDDTGCGNANDDNTKKRVACFNGSQWAISPAKEILVQTSEETIVASGNAACAQIANEQGVTGNYKFAAPLSFSQSQALQAVAADAGAGNVWINANDRKYPNTFVFNLDMDVLAPFWATGEPNDYNGNEDCAVQRSTGLWNDLNCASSQPVACFNPWQGANGSWSVTTTTHPYTQTAQMSLLCEQTFGGQYKFYAPETLSQRTALQAAMASAGITDAYINADDQQSEGTWQLNKSINNWAAGQPSTQTTERCVTASATDSQWRARNCGDSFPVACTSGGRWYFTTTAIALNDFSSAQQACSALGNGYLFNAPRSLDDALLMQYFARLAGVGGDYWINGNRLENVAVWEWNQRRLKTPLWSATDPDGGRNENCAVLNNNTEATWSDAACEGAASYAYLCRNGDNWQVSALSGNLQSFANGVDACQALGSGWVFAAPATYNENLAAKNAMGAAPVVWLNATDAMKEGVWVLNAAPINRYPGWAAGQPDNGNRLAADESVLQPGEDCVYQTASGEWYDTSCVAPAEYPWACTDGYVWKVTQAEGRAAQPAAGHQACFTEYGAEFVFAAPLNENDAVQIDFARLLSESERGAAIARVWLNMNDGGYEDNRAGAGDGRHFRKNQPFTNWVDAYPGVEPAAACVYKPAVIAGQNNPWRTASCTGYAAHYACTDGARWKVATSKGALVSGTLQITPQLGEDFWSYERGNSRCKEQFGTQYYFAAPVTAAEDLALDNAIRNADAQVKNTWINYYHVNAINPEHNPWFSSRLKLGTWQKPEFRNINNADCAVLHADGSLTDVACTSNYAYACYDGQWQVTGNGSWNAGFAACDDQLGGSLFAVPRTPDDLEQLRALVGSEPVWVNFTDTALESQWIANRLRFTWWKAGEPSNSFNRDCARVGSDGGWYAGRCSVEQAAFACRSIQGANLAWQVTSSRGIWSEGFSACAREYPGSEFFAPQGYGSQSAKADQLILAAAVASAGQDVWINLSDQDVEGSWRAHQAYSHWGVASLIDQTNDCAYLSRVATGSGSWYADSCKYTAATAISRGYACTNGYEWKLVETAVSADMRWSEGFSACQTLGSGWRYAAPTDGNHNAKLKLAMELAGLEQVWINAQDRTSEGNWQINGPETNFAPIANVSQTATQVPENSANLLLRATLEDDEEQGIAAASWVLVSDSRYSNVADSGIVISNMTLTPGAAGSATLTAQYSTPVLLKNDVLLTFKVTATDIPPGTAQPATSETFVTVRVKAPLLAAWDFNDPARPGRDVSGNGHDALNTAASPLPAVMAGVLSLSGSERMVVPGLAADAVAGLDIPASEYSVAFRISIETLAAGGGSFRGILQKGDDGMERQPALFLFPDSERIHATNSTTLSNNRAANSDPVLPQQWLNLVYNKRADGFDLYVDGELVSQYQTFDSGETSVANTGNFYVGAIPGSGLSFSGLIDDIQIYNRLLDVAEREAVLPPPPAGVVQFVNNGVQVSEDSGSVSLALERSRGSKEPLTVHVDLDSLLSNVTLGTQADISDPAHPADLAFAAAYVPGTGMPVSWPANTRGQQTLTLTLDNADDNLREGTELARLRLVDTAAAAAGANSVFVLRLQDVTPNPFGNFSVVGPDPELVLENDAAVYALCIRRESGATGAVNVNYSLGGSAVAGTDFQYLASGIEPLSATGTVTFADGDSTDKCFDVQALPNPAIGTDDQNLTLTITGLNHDVSLDPILTTQSQAQIVFRDYAPGEFAFSAGSYECKEPNTRTTVPVELRPSLTELECEITVMRSDISQYAPAAALTVSAPVAADYVFTSVLQWPAISPSSPATPETEVQTITFTITDDDVQEDNLPLTLTLLPSNGDGHDENITQPTAALTIIDVTSPALISLSAVQSAVNEGDAVVFRIERSGNPNTAFTFEYQVDVEGKTAGKTNADYLDFAAGAAESGVMTYSLGGGNVQQLSFRTIDTLEPLASVGLRLTLKNPSTPRTVGMGALTNVNLDNTINRTDALVTVLNTKDRLEDNYSISVGGTVFTPAVTPAAPAFSTTNTAFNPARTVADLAFTIPARNTLDINHTKLRYTWRLVESSWFDGYQTKNNADAVMTNASGVLDYGINAQDPAQAISVSSSIRIPFVVESTSFTLELTIEGGDGVTYPEVFTKQIAFTAQPLWRYFKLPGQSNPCLSNDPRREICGGSNDTDDDLWTINPDNRLLINKASYANGSAYCFQLNTDINVVAGDDIYMRNCNTGTAGQIMGLGENERLKINGRYICAIGDRNLNSLSADSSCSANDKRWVWE